MLKNYFKIAIRNLWKNKGFTFINIAGLAIGLACFIVIALYVKDELSYDRFYPNAERVYRVDADIKFGGNQLNLTVSSDPMGATLKKDYPQVEEYTRVYASEGGKLVRKGNDYINEDKIVYADSTFFNIFPQKIISGETKTALYEPNTVVISETTAKKYFSTTDAAGKTLEIDKKPFKVTAVIKDMPHNSHFHFDFIMSMKNVDYGWNNYLSHNFHTYILLKPGTDYHAFEKNFEQVLDKYVLPQAKQMMTGLTSMDDFRKSGNYLNYSLMPLTKIHLYSHRFPELEANGNIQYVYIFSAVALFILLIACINFMNLSTARSVNRAKEVGIRKVLGTGKGNLVAQFLSESTLMAFVSMLLALVLTYFTLPVFNKIAAKSMDTGIFWTSSFLPILIMLPFIVGLLAGLYPAFFLSKFKPISVLKGKINAGFKKSTLRSGLVVFQFFTSIVLIIGTVIVYKQLHFIQTTNLGFSKNQVLMIDGTGALNKNDEAFKNTVLGLPGVESGTMSGFLPVTSSRSDNTYSKDAVMDPKNALSMQSWVVDYDYINTLGMQIIKGRNFSKDFGTDSTAVILNETAAKVLGYDDPIGKKLYQDYQDQNGTRRIVYTIIGIVKDFHFESLRQNIFPLGLKLGHNNTMMSFKIAATDLKPLISQIQNKWKALAPGMPFSYRFMDDAFDNMYRAEQRVEQVSITFAVLAILIACLGLFGLVTYMAEQRTKEIGVRKVLGASVPNLVTMLSKDFLKLVLIASLIAFPVAWWVMHQWLQDFAYRIRIDWWVFILAGLIALLIALATVSFQAIKAALANPVESLRTE
ncbi:MAG: ABC transporter permease [Bacteroidetes bacterium]|nr:ABC transporter permease [Bacteroidota bacterium]MBS1930936.1 ABC transporter permease [Bacteroidota bacterium]